MNIVIAGYGYVGKAVESFIKEHHNVTIVDPAFNKTVLAVAILMQLLFAYQHLNQQMVLVMLVMLYKS